MKDNMTEIEQTETVLDNERQNLKVHIGNIAKAEEQMRDEQNNLEKHIR